MTTLHIDLPDGFERIPCRSANAALQVVSLLSPAHTGEVMMVHPRGRTTLRFSGGRVTYVKVRKS